MNLRSLPTLLGCLLAAPLAHAEEGMWLFTDFPSAEVQKVHGFSPSAEWLGRVRSASVRLAGGCSASFVSPQGLVMTNHHCVRSCVEDLSRANSDYMTNGFWAATPKDERRCPKIEANQLVEITDVTAKVSAATQGLTGPAYNKALKAELGRLESACAEGPQVRCDVVTLFHGGRYHLYRYRRLQDVRLVFAPEYDMAAFGGDPDNFNFPRYAFDVAFLRVYENGAPHHSREHLTWAREPAKEGDLTFVSGHPGGTERSQTVAQLEFQRDVALPYQMVLLAQQRGMMLELRKRNAELSRVSRPRLRSIENSLKALKGRHAALAEPRFLASRRTAEAALLADIRKRPAQAPSAQAFADIATALETFRPLYNGYRLKEAGDGFSSELFGLARTLVRASEERPKPNLERLREFTDAKLPGLEQQLFRDSPIPLELNEVLLAASLNHLRETLGADDPLVRRVLGKRSPEAVARAVTRGSRLTQVSVRKALYEGGKAAVLASTDPMIKLALEVDPDARQIRKEYEDGVEAVINQSGEKVAAALLAVKGTSGYPDATFTLRLSYGTVKGAVEGGKDQPALTTIAGLFARDTGEEPYAVTKSWSAARAKLDLETPMNLATTHDIIGGNSGSPLINRDAEVVGLVFDGNLASLGGRYGYEPATNRAVSVHAAGILEALRKVYRANRLVAELRPPEG